MASRGTSKMFTKRKWGTSLFMGQKNAHRPKYCARNPQNPEGLKAIWREGVLFRHLPRREDYDKALRERRGGLAGDKACLRRAFRQAFVGFHIEQGSSKKRLPGKHTMETNSTRLIEAYQIPTVDVSGVSKRSRTSKSTTS